MSRLSRLRRLSGAPFSIGGDFPVASFSTGGDFPGRLFRMAPGAPFSTDGDSSWLGQMYDAIHTLSTAQSSTTYVGSGTFLSRFTWTLSTKLRTGIRYPRLLCPHLVYSNRSSTCAPRKRVGVSVFHVRAMLDFKQKFLKSFLPSSLLAYHLWSILRPGENGMVGSHQDLSS